MGKLLRRRQPRTLPDAVATQHSRGWAAQQLALLDLGQFPRVGDAEEGRQRRRDAAVRDSGRHPSEGHGLRR